MNMPAARSDAGIFMLDPDAETMQREACLGGTIVMGAGPHGDENSR